MPTAKQTQTLHITGVESQLLSLEDYANFLRDLVFLHDRLWCLSLREDFPEKLYFASYFYARGSRRIPERHELKLVSARIASPFDLKVDVNVGDWFEGMANGLVAILKGISTLGEHRKQEKLRTRALIAQVETEESLQLKRRQLLISDLSIIRELPALQGEDRASRLLLLEKDAKRLSESPLQIKNVEILDVENPSE